MSEIDEAVKRLAGYASTRHYHVDWDTMSADIRTVLVALAELQSVRWTADAMEKVTSERDEALAVIERAKGHAHECYRSDLTCVPIEVLNTAPVDALRERVARVFAEGAREGYSVAGGNDGWVQPWLRPDWDGEDNPYVRKREGE